MASYPAPSQASLTVFNPKNFETDYDEPTIEEGDSRYLKKSTGGTVAGSTTFSNNLKVSSVATTTYGRYELGSTVAWSSGSKFQTNSPLFAVNQGSYLLIKGLSASDFSGAWTIECWYRSTATNQTGTFLSTYCASKNYGIGFDINYVSTLLIPYVVVGNSSSTMVDQPCSSKSGGTNTWFHIGVSFDGTNTYRVYDNGTIFSSSSTNVITASDLATYGICIGARMKSSGVDVPDFTNQCACQVSDLRISKTVRYTGSTYTVPTSAFVSDTNTVLINTLASSDLYAWESSPNTSSTGTGTTIGTTGTIANENSITTKRNGITATTGAIVATNGKIQSYRDFTTDNAGWRIGADSIFSTATLSTTSATGAYTISSNGWTTSGSSHVIPPQLFIMNISHRNVMGQFLIACSDKSSSSGKAGLITADYFYPAGATSAQVTTIATSKGSTNTLTSFSVTNTASSAGITVTTDASMRVSWMFRGFI